MASLLPDAHNSLTLEVEQSKLVPRIGETAVGNLAQRMSYLRKQFGDSLCRDHPAGLHQAETPQH